MEGREGEGGVRRKNGKQEYEACRLDMRGLVVEMAREQGKQRRKGKMNLCLRGKKKGPHEEWIWMSWRAGKIG